MNNLKYIWVLLTALAFGTMEIALKIGGSAYTALQLTFLRFLIGGLFLLPFAIHDLKKRNYRLTGHDIGFIAMLGLINIVVSMTLFQESVMHTNANLAAVLISFNPMFTMVFAHFVASERFTKKKALVLAICMTGLVLVANPLNLASGNEPIGIAMGLGASAAFGLYTALSKRCVGRIGGMALNSMSFLIGAFFELIVLLAMGEPVFSGINADTIGVLLYVGFIVTGFGYFCFMRAIEKGGASTASYAFFVKPIIAMILAAIILSEPITWNIVLGILLILAGCIFNVYHKKPKAEPGALTNK
ncbi:MAG: DMT family transporter [Proteobacteria bacterium]|nr:DMT family transporter [Pseudomonadota bacterium]